MIVHEYNGKTYRWEQTHSGPVPVDADLMPLKHVPRGFHEAYQDWYWKHHKIRMTTLKASILTAKEWILRDDPGADYAINAAWSLIEPSVEHGFTNNFLRGIGAELEVVNVDTN
jgi:hypothetical protein